MGSVQATYQEADVPKDLSRKARHKRASEACLSCRSRKVRCDVSTGRKPCTNCFLDERDCVVGQRRANLNPRGRKKQVLDAVRQPRRVSQQQTNAPCSPGAESVASLYFSQHSDANLSPPDASHTAAETPVVEPAKEPATSKEADLCKASRGHETASSPSTAGASQPLDVHRHTINSSVASPRGPSSPEADLLPRLSNSADVPYSCFPFLTVNQMHKLSPACVHFLEAQRCFRVPISPILDAFVREYFLHVHPFLPIINEGDFWDIYRCDGGGAGENTAQDQGSFPLVVLQAMLLASCSFVPQTTIQALGFLNARLARRAFYQRGKLLFQLQSETSPLYLSQAALLLSTWSPPFREAASKLNTTWLRVAIEQAKNAGAHQRVSSQQDSSKRQISSREHSLLRRLWFCCIVRDRLLSFGLRRNVQISNDDHELDDLEPFTAAELSNEIQRSKVYFPDVKERLVMVFTQLTEMCCLMTNVGSLIFPFDKSDQWDKVASKEDLAQVRSSKLALQQWYTRASRLFWFWAEPNHSVSLYHQDLRNATTLFVSLLFIYYYSSMAAIFHFEMLQGAIAPATTSTNIHEPIEELQNVTRNLMEHFKKLSRYNVNGYLPITAIACTAVPLTMHSLGARSYLNPPPTELAVLYQQLRLYESQYDGVEWVSETVLHILDSLNDREFMDPWASLLTSTPFPHSLMGNSTLEPSTYLKAAIILDLSLSKGYLPKTADFPSRIKEFFQRSQYFAGALSESLEIVNSGHFSTTEAITEGGCLLRESSMNMGMAFDDVIKVPSPSSSNTAITAKGPTIQPDALLSEFNAVRPDEDVEASPRPRKGALEPIVTLSQVLEMEHDESLEEGEGFQCLFSLLDSAGFEGSMLP